MSTHGLGLGLGYGRARGAPKDILCGSHYADLPPPMIVRIALNPDLRHNPSYNQRKSNAHASNATRVT